MLQPFYYTHFHTNRVAANTVLQAEIFRNLKTSGLAASTKLACGGSSPSDDPGDDEDTTAYFYVSNGGWGIGFMKQDYSDIGFMAPDIAENSTLHAAKLALTEDDIVFTPTDIVEMTSFDNDASGSINYNLTDLDTDNVTTVTVSIKDKNGIKFVKVTGGKDQFDI